MQNYDLFDPVAAVFVEQLQGVAFVNAHDEVGVWINAFPSVMLF